MIQAHGFEVRPPPTSGCNAPTTEWSTVMNRKLQIVVALLVLGSTFGIALAGGRAQVSILSVPKQIVAGVPAEITLAVNPEWPGGKSRTLDPVVKAVCGDRAVTCATVPLKTRGRYRGTLTLPAAGDWVITVDSRFCETRMAPLTLHAEAQKQRSS